MPDERRSKPAALSAVPPQDAPAQGKPDTYQEQKLYTDGFRDGFNQALGDADAALFECGDDRTVRGCREAVKALRPAVPPQDAPAQLQPSQPLLLIENIATYLRKADPATINMEEETARLLEAVRDLRRQSLPPQESALQQAAQRFVERLEPSE